MSFEKRPLICASIEKPFGRCGRVGVASPTGQGKWRTSWLTGSGYDSMGRSWPRCFGSLTTPRGFGALTASDFLGEAVRQTRPMKPCHRTIRSESNRWPQRRKTDQESGINVPRSWPRAVPIPKTSGCSKDGQSTHLRFGNRSGASAPSRPGPIPSTAEQSTSWKDQYST